VPHRLTVARRRPIRAARLLAVTILIAGCGRSRRRSLRRHRPISGITAELAKRGVQVNHFVSGDAGCADPVLTPTVIAFDAAPHRRERAHLRSHLP
jgi:hypothetical protein